MIRLIASDIDGTLLRDGAVHIAPALFDQIHRLRERGVLFCPPAADSTAVSGGSSRR